VLGFLVMTVAQCRRKTTCSRPVRVRSVRRREDNSGHL